MTDALTAGVPRAQVVNFADLLGQVSQVLNNLLLMLTAIASLSLFAGIVIIANAVALAMLERRRELGIMKSVGYTSRRVLGVVLIENGLIGGLGGLLGMLIVAAVTFVFNRFRPEYRRQHRHHARPDRARRGCGDARRHPGRLERHARPAAGSAEVRVARPVRRSHRP